MNNKSGAKLEDELMFVGAIAQIQATAETSLVECVKPFSPVRIRSNKED
jgi:hypothetical protein